MHAALGRDLLPFEIVHFKLLSAAVDTGGRVQTPSYA